jgi:hypothetical protein
MRVANNMRVCCQVQEHVNMCGWLHVEFDSPELKQSPLTEVNAITIAAVNAA